MKIAVQLAPENARYAAIRDAAARAEDLGADLIVNWDHFFPLGKDRTGRHFECWTMLGAWAESTARARIGAMVTCVVYRNPDLLADMARTVDEISGGRLVLGLGAGFREWEATQYGYEFGTPGQRVTALSDALDRIAKRLGPDNRIPILVAGDGPRTLRLIARYADIWHTFADGEELSEKSLLLDGFCQELGRDPATIERSVFVHEGPDNLADDLLARGVTQVTVFTTGPDFDLTHVRSWLSWRATLSR